MTETNVEPDLEALRDEKVVPVVQGVLEDMAGAEAPADINADTDFTALLIKVLKRALEADLNLTTENSYVFQLMLGAYSSFSTVVQKCKVAEAQDVRYGNIGHELMKILASAKVPMGTKVTPDQQIAAFEAVQPQIEEIFARENLTWLEIKYILEGLFRSLKAVEQLFSVNVDKSLKRMEAKILGIESMEDLGMKKLEEVLMADISTTTVPPPPPVDVPPPPADEMKQE